MNGHPSRRRRMRDQVSLRYRPRVEWLEDRTAPSVSFAETPPGSGLFTVTFTEGGAADALVLRRSGSGLLEHSLNGGPFKIDLDSATPGDQPLSLNVITRIDVLLGAGNDTLTLDFSGGQVIPIPGLSGIGISYAGAGGVDRIIAARDTDMTLSDTVLLFGPGGSGGTVALSSIDQAQLTGGNSPNAINAAGFSGTTTIHGGNQTDTVHGGSGNDVLSGDEGSDQLFGNAGNDLLDSTNSGNSFMDGGPGNDTLLGGNGKDTMEGGDGDDVLVGGNGSDTMLGEGGDDILEGEGGNDVVDGGDGFDEVVGEGAVNFTITNTLLTGLGTDTLTSIEQARLTGGTNNTRIDASGFTGSLIASGGGGGTDTLIGGGQGSKNRFELIPSGSVSLIDSGGLNEVSFATSTSPSTGYTINLGISNGSFQNVDGSGYLVGLNGSFQNAYGSAGSDRLTGNELGNILIGDGAFGTAPGGSDTLDGGAGNDILIGDGEFGTAPGGSDSLDGGAGDDILTGDGAFGSALGGNDTLNGGDGNDILTGDGEFGSAPGGDDSLNGGAGDDILIGDGAYGSAPGGSDSLDGGAGDDILTGDGEFGSAPGNDTLDGGAGNDILTGDGAYGSAPGGDDSLDGGAGDDILTGDGEFGTAPGNDTLNGGDGNDVCVFVGSALGSDVIVEAPNDDSDTLDFSGFDAPVTLDLAFTGPQLVAPGFSLTLTSGTGLENVIGSKFPDTILGNSRPNLLKGTDQLRDQPAAVPSGGVVTQRVYLNFSATDGDDYVYSPTEKLAIKARMELIFARMEPVFASFLEFSLTEPAEPYAHLKFNVTPVTGPGGLANQLDFRNADPRGFAEIDVNGLLGGPGQPVVDPNLLTLDRENLIAMTATVGAHELGHLLGLRHVDSFGPIGSGISVDPARFFPTYPGPLAANETFSHLMATPASVRSSLFDAVAVPILGEREAVKLAFNAFGSVVGETEGAASEVNDSRATAQAINLAQLYVPNTLQPGAAHFGKDIAVSAVAVTGRISVAGADDDYYSFVGKAGDLINLEVLSRTLAHRYADTIDSIVRIYDAAGVLVPYHSSQAVNDDDMDDDLLDIGRGSILIDLVLPADGIYFIQIDTFELDPDVPTDTGFYELFVYRFDAGNATDGGDVLVGNAGNDSLSGGDGRDILIGGLGADALDGGGGEDILIGGRTSHDADLVVLHGLMFDWALTETYKKRTGILSDRLNTRTVFADSAADTLVGGADTDWFFGDKLDGLPDRVSPDEILVKVN